VSVLKITDGTLFARLSMLLALEVILLVIIHVVDPVVARTDTIRSAQTRLALAVHFTHSPLFLSLAVRCLAISW
jgi:hypothetical protein